jgi:hypothetical protein
LVTTKNDVTATSPLAVKIKMWRLKPAALNAVFKPAHTIQHLSFSQRALRIWWRHVSGTADFFSAGFSSWCKNPCQLP